ncbi:MAG: hypothetical protein IIZ59_00120 [Clostridia bacterium]|nr:hypothetical protein [Clostridia bacterium]
MSESEKNNDNSQELAKKIAEDIAKEIARKILLSGELPPERIAEFCSLTVEQVNALRVEQ